ncbi:pathogenesis-related thaumatin-like protein 3.5 [Solanum lycopersicum]|uniref:pathogenesis-related thaumatin-like protein 3.5 n=1 Tax=Solanum lycopersicum TaxID=4081 RepID=UPI0002765BBE|nr:pathogenesis-related protein 5 [Solanum lycopersicum]
MLMNIISSKTISFSLLLCSFFSYTFAYNFIIRNNCPFTIWPGTLAGAGTPPLPATGFRLDAGQSITIPSVAGWSGRIWARTGCTFDASGIGSCQTGDCGGKLECSGLGATPPASLFEITLGVGDNKDFYDVSIVDGYNLPMVALPQGVNGGCNATGCLSNLNMGCPKELQVMGEYGGEGNVVACKSACEAFGLDQYCCAGQFANPTTCQPSFYSTIFKNACPRAYSYAFDDGTSTFTCKANDYAIIFCPMNGVKRPNEEGSTTQATQPIEESKTGKFAETMASTSNIILLPFPMLIHMLLIFSLHL